MRTLLAVSYEQHVKRAKVQGFKALGPLAWLTLTHRLCFSE